jgi:hypothetical protein
MRSRVEAPAFFSLIIFLAINYLIGYGAGYALTHSVGWSIAIALVTPCLSLFGYALLTGRRADRHLRQRAD